MNFLIMLLVAVGLYFFTNKLIVRIEQSRGAPFKERSVVFFGIFLGSMLIALLIIENLL